MDYLETFLRMYLSDLDITTEEVIKDILEESLLKETQKQIK